MRLGRGRGRDGGRFAVGVVEMALQAATTLLDEEQTEVRNAMRLQSHLAAERIIVDGETDTLSHVSRH